MHFLLLSIIMSTAVLSGCGKASKVSSNNEGVSAHGGAVASGFSTARSGPDSIGGFQYRPVERLAVKAGGDLKQILELGMIDKLQQLSHSHDSTVFSHGLSVDGRGAAGGSADHTASLGDYWFVGATEDAIYADKAEPGLDVWSVDPVLAGATRLRHISFVDYEAFANIGSMHLVSGEQSAQLMLRREISSQDIDGSSRLSKPSLPGPHNSSMLFQWANIDGMTTRSQWQPADTLLIDGQFIVSRRYENTLYVVSQFWAWQYGVGSESGGEQLRGYMPAYVLNGQERQPLSQSCLSDGSPANASLLNITAIDMNSRMVVSSQCVSARVDGVHFSETGLYLGRQRQSDIGEMETEIHQFLIQAGALTYSAGGAVPGVFSWDGSVALTEINQSLYVVSTQRDEGWRPMHAVYRIQGSGGRLEYLEASAGEGPLLEGAELLEARFVGARVYLVSGDPQVPTSVVDLLGGSGPAVLGVLALDERFLARHKAARWLAVGPSHILSIANEMGAESLSGGLALSLIDVRDVGAPKVTDELYFAGLGTSSEAVSDLASLAITENPKGGIQFALPVAVYKEASLAQELVGWDYSGLYLFDVALAGGEASLTSMGAMVVAESEGLGYEARYTGSRALIRGDSIFYYFNGQVFGALQSLIAFVNGPF